MAFESTADLLFNITADAGEAEANVQQFRELNAEEVAKVKAVWADFVEGALEQQAELAAALEKATVAEREQTEATEELAAAHGHAVSEIQATSGAIRLLEGSGGIRAMERFTATTLGLGPALQAIFPIVGALAFTEIIVRMGEKVYDLYKQWDPVSQAEKRAADTAKALGGEIRSLGEELRKLDAESFTKAFGVVAGKMHESADIIERSVSADQKMIAFLNLELEKTQKIISAGTHTHQLFPTISDEAKAAAEDVKAIEEQLTAFQLQLAVDQEKASILTTEAMEDQQKQTEKAAKEAGKAKDEFFGLSAVLESLKAKVAESDGPWAKLNNEVQHYRFELAKAEEELAKLQKSGTVRAESVQREMAALAQIPAMIDRIVAETSKTIHGDSDDAFMEKLNRQVIADEREADELKKAGETKIEIQREISDRLNTADQQSFDAQRARLQQEISAWKHALEQKAEIATGEAKLITAQYADIDRITADGLAKIGQSQAQGYALEVQKLQERLARELSANLTGAAKLAEVYQKDLQLFSATEEAKAKKTADSEAERAQIEQLYAQLRSQVAQKFQTDLQTLQNSQGFQGVFGNYFASLIRGNENLLKQWSQSSNQSLMGLAVAWEAVKNMSLEAFKSMAQGMGQNIEQAIQYGTSMEEAMQKALAAALDSFAAQAFTAAIMATGYGLFDLAMGNYGGAAEMFASAAVFGTVGTVAAVLGKYAGGSQAAPGASGSDSGVQGLRVARAALWRGLSRAAVHSSKHLSSTFT